MKIKVLLSSVLSIVLCLTMIAGATYALFTDSETVNIAVTAGKVDIDVTVNKIQTLSYPATDWDDDLKFTNGGLVNYTKDATTNELTLDKITPGDAVKVNMNVVNNSDVKIKYRVKVGVTSGLKLFKALDVSIGGVAADYKGMTFVSDWVELNPIAGEDKTFADIALEIKLPYLTAEEEKALGVSQNDLMGESTTLYYTVQAVQGNASAEDLDAVEDGTTYIYNAIDLELFAENVKNGNTYKGETVQLMSDVDLAGIEWTPVSGFQGTFDGKKTALTSSATDTLAATDSTTSTETAAVDTYTIKNLTVKGNSSVGFFANISGGALVQNVTFDNANVTGNHWVGVVFGWEGSESVINTVKNVHIVNSAVTCEPELVEGVWDNGDKAGAIGGYAVTTVIEGCTVKNTTINAYRDLGGILGYAHESAVVTNCVVENVTLNVNSTYNYQGYTSPVDFDANSIVGQAVATAKIEGNNGEATVNYNIGGVEYVAEGNTLVLFNAANFTGNKLIVPEGVTALGNWSCYTGAFEEIVLPSTLKTVGNRAFKGNTTLKSITLPAGVETIVEGAFQQATVESVTVLGGSIGKQAFAYNNALKSVVLGENVTYVENYAFRGCASLESVVILSENITFGGTSMAFSNADSGKSDNITIYVPNETVANAVKAANGSCTGYKVVVMGDVVTPEDNATAEENKTALENAIADALANAAAGEDVTVYVSEGNYKFPATSSFTEGVTLICAEGTVFEGASAMNINGATVVGGNFSNPGGSAGTSTVNGTYKDCTFYGSNGLRWCYAGDTVVFENCVFDGSVYGVHFDGGANKVKFVNCTISGFNTMGGAIEMLTMEGCTFKANGRSGYNGINLWGSAEMTDCTFVFDGTTTEWIDLCGDNKTATFTNCVVTDGTTEKDIATVIGDYGTGNTIIIDGAQVVTTADALIAAINSNATKVLLAEGEYALRFTNDTAFNVDGMTIIGIGNAKISISSSEVWYGRIQGDDVTFENITFTSSVGCTGKATYNNCTFNGDWAICASSGMKETYFNDCTINATLNTSTDFSSGNVYVKNCTITKAEYSAPAATTLYFENSTIGELITWNANTVLTGCTVTTLDDSHMTTGTITIK